MSHFTRTYALEDVKVRAGGDGRTVDAYAAVFGVPAQVSNRAEGIFNEVLAPGAFDKTIAQNMDRFTVLFNHGKTVYGTPSERFAMPIGKPLEVRADAKGVFTSTRYNRSQLADEVLAGIDNGDITGQSFTGRFVRTEPATSGPIRPNADGSLKTVLRTEVAMSEYGPGIIPVYKEAGIIGVRNEEIADLLAGMDPAERAELIKFLSETSTRPDGAPLPADASDAATSGTSEAAARAWASVRTNLRLKGIV